METGCVSEKSVSAHVTGQKASHNVRCPHDAEARARRLAGLQSISFSLLDIDCSKSCAACLGYRGLLSRSATRASPWCGTVGLPPSHRGDLPRYDAELPLACNRISWVSCRTRASLCLHRVHSSWVRAEVQVLPSVNPLRQQATWSCGTPKTSSGWSDVTWCRGLGVVVEVAPIDCEMQMILVAGG
jgi:hypothetical protein